MQRFRERGLKWALAPGGAGHPLRLLRHIRAQLLLLSHPGEHHRRRLLYRVHLDGRHLRHHQRRDRPFHRDGHDGAAIIGGTALKHGFPMVPSLLLIIVVGLAFGLFNGLFVSRLKMPPFIVTLGTMMISMGVGSIVSNVPSATFPIRGTAGRLVQEHLPLPHSRRRRRYPPARSCSPSWP